jgi:hypothetical protein
MDTDEKPLGCCAAFLRVLPASALFWLLVFWWLRLIVLEVVR